MLEVEPDILFDACEQLLAARQNQLAGLSIIEQPEHHPGQQQQEREHGTDVHVQGEATLLVFAHGRSLPEVKAYRRF
ncbi:hypothetical protein D3C86_1896890 [compost metagenome]